MDGGTALTPKTTTQIWGAMPEDLDHLLDLVLGGTETASVDDKGRMLISASKRRGLGEKFFMSSDPRGCIVAFSKQALAERLKEFRELPPLSRKRQILGHILGRDLEKEVHCDAQGRVVLPMRLRKSAGISGKVEVVGSIDQVEIWNPQKLEEYYDSLREIADNDEDLLEWARGEGKSK